MVLRVDRERGFVVGGGVYEYEEGPAVGVGGGPNESVAPAVSYNQ